MNGNSTWPWVALRRRRERYSVSLSPANAEGGTVIDRNAKSSGTFPKTDETALPFSRSRFELHVGSFAMAEVTCPPGVPLHLDRSVMLNNGAKLLGVLADHSLADMPGGAVGGRGRVNMWHCQSPLSAAIDNP